MPSFKKISRNTLFMILIAAISSSVTYFVLEYNYSFERDAFKSKIQTLEKKEREALITQRISDQMSDIATDQANIADSARTRALFESQKATEQAQRAEQERHNALLAKDKADKAEALAREQAAKAEHESYLAQIARDEAEKALAEADTANYQMLGRSLAQASINQYNAGEYDLAHLLAYSSYYYTTQYGGNLYQQEVFMALLDNAHNARNTITSLQGSIHAVKCIKPAGKDAVSNNLDVNILVASDYGEVNLLTPQYHTEDNRFNGFTSKELLFDKKYLFRDMCVKGDKAYILDINGRIISMDIDGNMVQKPVVYNIPIDDTHEFWTHLLLKKNGQLIALGKHHLAWVDMQKLDTVRTKTVEEDIIEAGIGDGRLLVFTTNKLLVYKEGIPDVEWVLEIPKQSTVTAYYYLKSKKLHVIGTDNGGIYFYNRNGELQSQYSFTGHRGPITYLKSDGRWLVSSSYDKTVRFWDLNNAGLVVPLEMNCNAWPLVFDIDESSRCLRLGLANGDIETIRYSAEDNAQSIRRYLTREFDPKEWHYYIGEGVPYRTFK